MLFEDLLARIKDGLPAVVIHEGGEKKIYPCGLVFRGNTEMQFTDEQKKQIRAAVLERIKLEVERWTN